MALFRKLQDRDVFLKRRLSRQSHACRKLSVNLARIHYENLSLGHAKIAIGWERKTRHLFWKRSKLSVHRCRDLAQRLVHGIHQKKLELIYEFGNVAGYKVIHKVIIFIHIINEYSRNDTNKTIPFIINSMGKEK